MALLLGYVTYLQAPMRYCDLHIRIRNKHDGAIVINSTAFVRRLLHVVGSHGVNTCSGMCQLGFAVGTANRKARVIA